MEKYNKVYLAVWLLFSAITLAFMIMFVLNNLAVMFDVDENVENEGLGLSFLLLFFTSEVIGFILATLTIDRIPWAYCMPVFFALMNHRTILHHSFLSWFDPSLLGDIYVNREYGRYLHPVAEIGTSNTIFGAR